MMQADLFTELDALADVEDDWRELARERRNPFISPEWFRAWHAVAEADSTPLVVVVRDGERIVGVLPLVLERTGWRRTVRFAGAELGDQFHPACAEVDELAVARAAGTALAALPDWNVLMLDRVAVDAPWTSTFARDAGVSPSVVHRSQGVLPYADLTAAGGDWSAYLRSKSRNFREQVGRKLRTLEREHDVRFLLTSSVDAVRSDVGDLLELHQRRWSTATSIASPSAQTFLIDLARRTFSAGWLRLWRLEIDGVTVAAFYGWQLGERYLFYQSGRDPAWEGSSVGFLVLARALRDAVERGATVFDLLFGDESYKARFADAEHAVETLAHTRLRSGLRPFSWRLAQAGRARAALAAHALNIR